MLAKLDADSEVPGANDDGADVATSDGYQPRPNFVSLEATWPVLQQIDGDAPSAESISTFHENSVGSRPPEPPSDAPPELLR